MSQDKAEYRQCGHLGGGVHQDCGGLLQPLSEEFLYRSPIERVSVVCRRRGSAGGRTNADL